MPETVKPALTLVESSVLGALLLIAVAVAIGAIAMLVKVQTARVADQKSLSNKSEALTSKMTTAFMEMKGALESLKSSLDSMRETEKDTQKCLESQQHSFELLIMMRGHNPPESKGE